MEETLNVLVLVDFSDAVIERIRAVSPRLKVTRKVVKSAGDIAPEVWASTDILYTGSIIPEPDVAPRLRWIQSHNAGVDALMGQPLLAAEDIILTTVSGIHATTIAEFTFGMMLALARKIPAMIRLAQKADWPADRYGLLMPRELRGSTLGILGYGSIGREIARLGKAFGMEVLATKRDLLHPEPVNEYRRPSDDDSTADESTNVERLYPAEATRSMAALCDFLVVVVPLTPDTQNLVNASVLEAMKKTAYVINVARGNVIDEEALVRALQAGRIAGAALDVFTTEPLPSTSPLWKLDNVIISPHIAGNTDHYNEDAADVFIENLERYLNKRDLLNRVDRKRGY
ncbi:MAG TPA: D-2-hydroxyacid dehydrogenase [Aggregatilineales bacterium]|nr:D-2-hydroxyacid dehydrogenase [Aggregatilineales bacterium]